MVMLFMEPKVLRQVLKVGAAVTFRVGEHKLGKDWITDKRGGKKIADVVISKIVIDKDLPGATIYDLRPFLSLSGFKTTTEWIEAIKKLNPKTKPEDLEGQLYLVLLGKLAK